MGAGKRGTGAQGKGQYGRQAPKSVRGASHEIRIIGGSLRGRKIKVLSAPGLRPTTDRIRETVFNWLMFREGLERSIDVFAGTGAMSFEAVSRGVGRALMIEKNPANAKMIREEALELIPGKSEVVTSDALVYLRQRPAAPYDLAFLDPPFECGLLAPAAKLLSENSWLRDGALVYAEAESAEVLDDLPESFVMLKESHAGQVLYRLYEFRGGAAQLRTRRNCKIYTCTVL